MRVNAYQGWDAEHCQAIHLTSSIRSPYHNTFVDQRGAARFSGEKSLREEDLRLLLSVAYNLRSEWITYPINNRNKGVSDDGFV